LATQILTFQPIKATSYTKFYEDKQILFLKPLSRLKC